MYETIEEFWSSSSILSECYSVIVMAKELKKIQDQLYAWYFTKMFSAWESDWICNDKWDGEGIA
jgi:hypothetical protein